MRKSLLIAAGALLLSFQPARADMARGLAAYDAGDYRTARTAWLRCAESGNPDAQTALAGLYANGAGVAPDPVEAAKWFRRAARRGDPIAQLNLGDIHAKGIGVTADPVAAWVWFSLAARQGNEWAAGRRDAIALELAPDDRQEAERRLAAWQPVRR